MLIVVAFFALFGFLFLALLRSEKQSVDDALSHWCQSIEGVAVTPSEFYDAITERLNVQNIPGLSIQRVTWYEGGIQSDKRVYLRVRRDVHIYDLCAAPFGNSFFVSSWLSSTKAGLLEIGAVLPIFGIVCRALITLFDPMTYYRVDSASMFHESVHNVVLGVMDELTTSYGAQPIPELSRRPVLRALYAGR